MLVNGSSDYSGESIVSIGVLCYCTAASVKEYNKTCAQWSKSGERHGHIDERGD